MACVLTTFFKTYFVKKKNQKTKTKRKFLIIVQNQG